MPGDGRTLRLSGAIIAAALAALLVMFPVGPAPNRAAAEPLLSAPEASVLSPALASTPAKPQTDAFDCWLLDPDRLEQASDHGLCGDAFARAPETAALPEAPPPPVPSMTPARKPKAPERRVRSAGRNVSSTETHAMASSPARVSRGNDGDFFTNFQRDFRSLTNLLGGGSPSPRRGDDAIASHSSHNH